MKKPKSDRECGARWRFLRRAERGDKLPDSSRGAHATIQIKTKIPQAEGRRVASERTTHQRVPLRAVYKYILNDDAPRIKTAEKQKKPKPCFFFLLLKQSPVTQVRSQPSWWEIKAERVWCGVSLAAAAASVCPPRCVFTAFPHCGSKTPRAASTHTHIYAYIRGQDLPIHWYIYASVE